MSDAYQLIPHPVARPGGYDYKEQHAFQINGKNVTRTGDNIQVLLSFELKSQVLNNLIESGMAEFCLVAKCGTTNNRAIHRTSDKEVDWLLPTKDYARKVLFTPYVVAVKPFHMQFSMEEHDEEFEVLLPGGVDLESGSILAIGEDYEAILYDIPRIEAAIRLVPKHSIEKGMYEIVTDRDEIIINCAYETFASLNTVLIHSNNLLYPSLYMSAVESAIRALPESGHRKWADSLRKSLAEHDLSEEKEELLENSNKYAQLLLKKPLQRLIDEVVQ